MRPETRHSIVLLTGGGAAAILSVAYAVYVGRVLGPAAYADFAAAVNLAMLGQVAFGPINGTAAKFTAQYLGRGEPGRVRTLFLEILRRVAFYGLLGVAFASVFLQPLAALLRLTSIFPLLAAYAMVYLGGLLSLSRGIVRGAQNFGQYNANTISEAAVRLSLGAGLLALSCSATAGLLAYSFALAAALAISRFQLRCIWRGHAAQSVDGAAIRRFTLPMTVMMLTTAGFLSMDMLFVKHYFAAAQAGLYGAVVALAAGMGVLVTPFNILLLPLLTALHEKGQPLLAPLLRVCVYVLAVAVGPLLAFAIWPSQIMTTLYGSEFAAAAPLLVGIATARLIGHLNGLIALIHVSRNSFVFLAVYVPGLVAELVALLIWHNSLSTVVVLVVLAQLGTLAAMVLFIIAARPFGCGRRSLEGPPAAD